MKTARPVPTAYQATPEDEALLERLQRHAFGYFLRHTNPANGLVADTSRPNAPSSIATVGFALSAYPVGVERGWITRFDAVRRSLTVLRFFWHSDQSGTPDATGCHGFYYHFLHMDSGTRAWACEVSLIDSALLLAGMLTAAAYFTGADPAEAELRELAHALYGRADWQWAQQQHSGAVVHGWKPEGGFLHYGWEGYSEALLMYVLGLGSPTHPLTDASFEAWSVTYQWENLYGYDFLYAGPLFIHQFSHAWIDFRGIRDRFMREKRCDYFENSRRATYVQREYAIRNPRSFVGYGAQCWGLSAGDGPSVAPQTVAGRRQAFYGYAARGVPYGPDDGTISATAIVSSLVFAPEIVLPALRALLAHGSAGADADADSADTDALRALHASGFNATAHAPPPAAESGIWVSEGEFGLDQGMVALMVENFRSGLPWRLLRGCPFVRTGLRRAGFRGGWLDAPAPA